MTVFIILGLALVAVAAYILWNRRDRAPNKMHLGPWVHNVNKTTGTKLEGNSFIFPTKPDSVHSLVIPYTGQRSVTFRIDGDAQFLPQENPTVPGIISLMIQREGDDWSAVGDKIYYRLYSGSFMQIAPGTHTINFTEPCKPVLSGPSVPPMTEEQKQATLNNARFLHVCFGGGGSRAHGVYATGYAKFTLL